MQRVFRLRHGAVSSHMYGFRDLISWSVHMAALMAQLIDSEIN